MRAITQAGLWLIAPFFLQLLGFGNTPLGGGLCGALFDRGTAVMQDQGPGFWYAVVFMIVLGLWLMTGVGAALASLLDLPSSMTKALRSTLQGLVWTGLVLFVLTRTLGLPVPSSLGLSWGGAARLDPLSVILMACGVAALVKIGRNSTHVN